MKRSSLIDSEGEDNEEEEIIVTKLKKKVEKAQEGILSMIKNKTIIQELFYEQPSESDKFYEEGQDQEEEEQEGEGDEESFNTS
jgi:hypothetical protein